jgi:hypothetical protein
MGQQEEPFIKPLSHKGDQGENNGTRPREGELAGRMTSYKSLHLLTQLHKKTTVFKQSQFPFWSNIQSFKNKTVGLEVQLKP